MHIDTVRENITLCTQLPDRSLFSTCVKWAPLLSEQMFIISSWDEIYVDVENMITFHSTLNKTNNRTMKHVKPILRQKQNYVTTTVIIISNPRIFFNMVYYARCVFKYNKPELSTMSHKHNIILVQKPITRS